MSSHAKTTLLALALAATLSACGSGATTVTVRERAPRTTSTPAGTPSGGSSSATTTTATTQSPTSQSPGAGGASAPGQTHTAPEPAFAEGEAKGSAANAAAVVRAHGYTPVEPAQYHEGQTLAVLVGRNSGSSGAAGEQAFFFLDGRFLGTDTKEPSASVQLLAQNGTEVTLAYPLYRSGDATGSPSGGRAVVSFQLDDGKLQSAGQIPPVESTHALSRR